MKFNNVYINASAATVGKKEYEGPLGSRFDAFEKDEYFGCDNFEEAESEMVRRNLNILTKKANHPYDKIDVVFGGDLINQCVATSFAISETKIPFLGLYGACSTFIESIICSSIFIDGGFVNSAIGMASSHFCAAERQYRFPLEYGSVRTPTSQNTVTGTGAFHVSNIKSKIQIKSGVIGRIVDKGVTAVRPLTLVSSTAGVGAVTGAGAVQVGVNTCPTLDSSFKFSKYNLIAESTKTLLVIAIEQ